MKESPFLFLPATIPFCMEPSHTHAVYTHTRTHVGTVYLQTASPLLVVSGYTVYSVASALFMFPVLYDYYFRALEVGGCN